MSWWSLIVGVTWPRGHVSWSGYSSFWDWGDNIMSGGSGSLRFLSGVVTFVALGRSSSSGRTWKEFLLLRSSRNLKDWRVSELEWGLRGMSQESNVIELGVS